MERFDVGAERFLLGTVTKWFLSGTERFDVGAERFLSGTEW